MRKGTESDSQDGGSRRRGMMGRRGFGADRKLDRGTRGSLVEGHGDHRMRAEDGALVHDCRQLATHRAAASPEAGRRRRMHAAVVAVPTNGRLASSIGEQEHRDQHNRHSRPMKHTVRHTHSVALAAQGVLVTRITWIEESWPARTPGPGAGQGNRFPLVGGESTLRSQLSGRHAATMSRRRGFREAE